MSARSTEFGFYPSALDQENEIAHAIDNFMRALQTYSERAACEPGLTFEQHFLHIAAEGLQSWQVTSVH